MTKVALYLFLLLSTTICYATGPDEESDPEKDPPASFTCLNDSILLAFQSSYQINPDEIYCEELYCEIKDWLGVKYAYGKSSKNGTDCSGFVKNISSTLLNEYLKGSSKDIFKLCEPVNQEELQEGDLVFFKINKSTVSHIGIYLQNGKFIHASVKAGVIISDLEESYYKKYFYSGGRLK